MGVPKGKTSKANRRMNRAARCVIDGPALTICPQCKLPKQAHTVCASCGYYKGRPVINKEAKPAK